MMKLFTKALVLSLILIGTHAVAGTAGLAGNWMGPNGGTLNIEADGQGTVKSGACELKFKWASNDTEMTFNYYGKEDCLAYDQDFGKVRSGGQNLPKPDTMRYTLEKVTNMVSGAETMQLNIFTKLTPKGIRYIKQ